MYEPLNRLSALFCPALDNRTFHTERGGTHQFIYYFIDVIGEYYVDLLDKHNGDEDIDIDVEEVAKYVAKQAKKDKMGEFDPEDLRWVVDGELEYGESIES